MAPKKPAASDATQEPQQQEPQQQEPQQQEPQPVGVEPLFLDAVVVTVMRGDGDARAEHRVLGARLAHETDLTEEELDELTAMGVARTPTAAEIKAAIQRGALPETYEG